MTTARTLLLVDDDAESRASLQSLIESEGYQAEAVASGEAALKRSGIRGIQYPQGVLNKIGIGHGESDVGSGGAAGISI